MTKPLILAATGGSASPLKGGLYLKDLIRVGRFTHPQTGTVVEATPERLAHWAQTFQAMSAAGVPVEVVIDHQEQAEKTVGHLVDCYVEGEQLLGVVRLPTARGAELAETVRTVSVAIDPAFKAGNGQTYADAIRHVSISPKAVVPGQGGFVKLSAQGEDLPVLALQPDFEAQVRALQAANAQLQAQVQQLSAARPGGAPPALPEGVLELAAASFATQLEALAQQGRVSPACKQKLAAALLGQKGQRTVLLASLAGLADPQQSLVAQVLAALAENRPVELGEKTGVQTLANPAAGDAQAAQITDRMIADAGGKIATA
jgi:hypothetical protein